MFEKYITIRESKIVCGQRATDGLWYCKELPADNSNELGELITAVNKVLNKHNCFPRGKKTIEVKGIK